MDSKQKADTRPLLRNKVLYNRIINAIVSNELEECLESKGNSQILSDILTRMVYKSNGSSSRVTVLHDMLRRYTDKILNDCQALKLDPTAEFEPPESLEIRKKVFAAFEHFLFRNNDVKPGVDTKNFLLSSSTLEEIGKKVWGFKISQSCNAEQYKQLQNWVFQWYSKQQFDKNSSFNGVNENDHTTLPPKKKYGKRMNEFKRSSSMMAAKNSGEALDLSKIRNGEFDEIESATDPPENKIADENKEKPVTRELKTELIERHDKKPRLSKSIVTKIDIPPSSKNQEKNSAEDSETTLMNKTLLEVIMLMKKRDLVTRKQDEDILRQLEDYLGSLNRSKAGPETP